MPRRSKTPALKMEGPTPAKGWALRLIREFLGFKQEEFAKHVDVHRSTVVKYEQGNFENWIQVGPKILQGLHVTIAELENFERFLQTIRDRQDAPYPLPGSMPATDTISWIAESGSVSEINRVASDGARFLSGLIRILPGLLGAKNLEPDR